MPAQVQEATKTYTYREKRPNGDVYIFERLSKYDKEKKFYVSLKSKLVGVIRSGETEISATRPKRQSASGKKSHKNESLDNNKKGKSSLNEGKSSLNEEKNSLNEGNIQEDEQETPLFKANRTRIGMIEIIDHIGKISGIDDSIYASTDIGTAEKIISLARYFLATSDNTVCGMEIWQLNHKIPYDNGMSESICHDLFVQIGKDETLQQKFFLYRSRKINDMLTIAYDSTTLSTYSDNIIDAQYGFNKDNDNLKTIKILLLYSIDSKTPIAFTKQPGNIPDVLSITNALKQLEAIGIKNTEIVTDNGYYSSDNIIEILFSGFNFITLIKNNLKWVRNEIDKNINKLKLMSSICPFDAYIHGVTVPLLHTFVQKKRNNEEESQNNEKKSIDANVFLHIFYSELKKVEDRHAFDLEMLEIKKSLEDEVFTIDSLPPDQSAKASKFLCINNKNNIVKVSFNEDACNNEFKYHGFFVLLSNKESSPFRCLQKYRKRNEIESSFKYYKNNIAGKKPRVWSSDTFRGRLFVQFVALCYHEYLLNKIDEIKNTICNENKEDTKENFNLKIKLKSWLENHSLQYILNWFDTIENIDINTGVTKKRWNTEILQRDKILLKELGVTLPT